jgi:hypothetical protein
MWLRLRHAPAVLMRAAETEDMRTDPDAFAPRWVAGHAKITSAYLPALAVGHQGKLATFDRSIPIRAVRGAGLANLELIGAKA